MMGMKYLREEELVLSMVSESREGMAGQQEEEREGKAKLSGVIYVVWFFPQGKVSKHILT